MTELEKLCEQALYEEVRSLEDGRSIVKDNATGRLFYKKRLSVFNPDVFAWLKEHRSRYVPRIEAFWQDGDELVVVEEFIQGNTLEEILTEAENMQSPSFAERVRILTELCDGLSFLHSADPPIIHRDLKASNIMLTEDGVVKIIDYDAAKLYVKGQKRDTQLIGTQGTAAPEQYGFAASDARTDIYALGKLIQRMLPDNKDAARIAARATNMDPAKRYASAAQIQEQIRRIREKPSGLDSVLGLFPGYDSARRSHRIAGRIGVLVIVALLIAIPVFLYDRLVVTPRIQQEALEEELHSLEGNSVEVEEITEMSRQLLEQWPYKSMGSAQQKEFREVGKNLIMRCSRGNEGTQLETGLYLNDAGADYLAMLEEFGVDPQTITEIRIGGQLKQLINSYKSEKALAALEYLKGLPDEEEERERVYKAAIDNAALCEKSFAKDASATNASRALLLYDMLTDAGFAQAQKLFTEFYGTVLNRADELRDEEQYDDAKKIYEALTVYEGDAGLASSEESLSDRMLSCSYRKAQNLMKEGKYSSARSAFQEVGEYKDASLQADECAYLQAQKLASDGKYKEAADLYAKIPGYKEADEKLLNAKYDYCKAKVHEPDDLAYTYINELVAADYPGVTQLRNEMYEWHAKIDTGVGYIMGPNQAANIRATLYGGPDGASTHVTFEVTDTVTGIVSTWTSDETCKRGESATTSYYITTGEYSIFDREFKVVVYVDNGTQIGSWTGEFSDEFL